MSKTLALLKADGGRGRAFCGTTHKINVTLGSREHWIYFLNIHGFTRMSVSAESTDCDPKGSL
jgi:hypothetical protein